MSDATLDAVLGALSDPTRREVFDRVRTGPRSVGELASGLPVTRPAVSQHLKVLVDAGLVTGRAEGTRRIYSVRSEGAEVLRRYAEQMWNDALAAFARAAQEEHSR